MRETSVDKPDAMPASRPPLQIVSWPGLCPYRPFWDLQKRLWDARYHGLIPDTLLLLEHEPVVTLGRNADPTHVLLTEGALRAQGVERVAVDRGGDVTYHGPGQIVGYWIFDLRQWHLDLHRYLREIEEVLILTLRDFGLEGGRDAAATGVWVDGAKIAALGLHLSHWVSTHGFALNVETDLDAFSWIVPCGLHGRPVTSLARALGTAPLRSAVEARIAVHAASRFEREGTWSEPAALLEQLRRAESIEDGAERSVEIMGVRSL